MKPKKSRMESKSSSALSNPVPSTSTPQVSQSSSGDEVVIKTEPVDDGDDVKEELGYDMYFEIDAETLENQELFDQALAKIEEKILIGEQEEPNDYPVRNIVLCVPEDSNDDDDNHNGNITPQEDGLPSSTNDDEDEPTPSTSYNLRRSLRMQNQSTTTKSKIKGKGRGSTKSTSIVDDNKSPASNCEQARVQTVSPAPEVDSTTVEKRRKLEPVQTRSTASITVKKKRMLSLPDEESEHDDEDEYSENESVSDFDTPSSIWSRAEETRMKAELLKDVNAESSKSKSSETVLISCNEDSNSVSEPEPEDLQEQEEINRPWSPSSIKVEPGDETTSSWATIDNDLADSNEVEAQSPSETVEAFESSNSNTNEMEAQQPQQQSSIKMGLRKNPKPTFKRLLSADDFFPDFFLPTTSPSPISRRAEPELVPTVKRPRGRPRKHPRIDSDPALETPKKVGRPKISRSDEEIQERRRQKNCKRALAKRMRNQQRREQSQLSGIKPKATSQTKITKKIIKPYQHTWRPHPLELYNLVHRNYSTVCSTDLLSRVKDQNLISAELSLHIQQTALSVGHGTFENPHWTYEKNKFQCICPGCGETFMSSNELLLHKRKLHNDICPSCSICGKPVIRPDCLIRHKKRHFSLDELKACYAREIEKFGGPPPPQRNDRLYKCSNCSKILIGWASMRVHQKMHSEAYSIKCPICFKPIYRKDYLKYHLTTHLGFDERMKVWQERKADKAPRVRKLNGVSTIAADPDKRSINNSFQQSLRKPKIEVKPEKRDSCWGGPQDCQICGKTFKTIYILRKHTLTTHSKRCDENPFRTSCPICFRPFERTEYLSKHVQTHMNENEKQLFSKWSGNWRQFLESLKNGDELPLEPRRQRGRPKKQITVKVEKVAKKRGRPRKNLVK